jgi:uncharacterized protein (TIGR03067 family)
MNTESMQGTWVPVGAELAGKPFPEEVRHTIRLEVAGSTYTVTIGPAVDRGTLTLDASVTPHRLDITGTEGPNAGRTIRAIYEQEGDALRICYDLSGESRPTTFQSAEGTQLFLVDYRRPS